MKTSEDNDVFGKLDLEMKNIPVWGACLVDLFWLYAPEKTWLRWLVPESTALEEGPVFHGIFPECSEAPVAAPHRASWHRVGLPTCHIPTKGQVYLVSHLLYKKNPHFILWTMDGKNN